MDNVVPFAFRVDVVAFSVADLVKCAGGWLFDRAIAGWDVTVGVGDDQGVQALRILGLKAQPLESALESIISCPAPELAVAAEAWSCDRGVRDIVASALRNGNRTLVFWGDTGADELDRRLRMVRYQPSSAACAFKVHALAAAAVADDPGRVESFRSNRRYVTTDPESSGATPDARQLSHGRAAALAHQND